MMSDPSPDALEPPEERLDAGLVTLAVELGGCRTEDEVFEVAARHLPAMVGADHIWARRRSSDSERDRIVSLSPDHPAAAPSEFEVAAASIPEEREQRTVADPSDASASEALLLRRRGFRSLVVTPLGGPGGFIGALHAEYVTASGYSREDREAFAQTARAMAAAIARLRRSGPRSNERERPWHAARLAEMRAIETRISQALNRDEVFDAIAATIDRVLPANHVSFQEFVAGAGEVRTLGIVGPAADRAGGGVRVTAKSGSALGEIQARNSLYVPNTADADHVEHRALAGVGVGSVHCMSVAAGNRPVGTLIVGVPDRDGIDEAARSMLEGLAAFVGLTLERIEAQEGAAANVLASEALLRSLVDDCPVLLAVLDVTGTIRRVSEFGAQRLGYRMEDMVGKPFAEFHPASEWKIVGERLASVMAAGRSAEGDVLQWEVRMTAADGETRWTRQYGRFLTEPDGTPMVMLTCEDVTEVRELHDRLALQAERDSLTGVSNRAVLESRLEELAQQRRGRGALMVLDVDHFKLVNDRLGHAAGDEVLRRLTAAVQHALDPSDLVARIGGDEFVVLMPQRSLESATQLGAQLVRDITSMTVESDGAPIETSVSIGIAHYDGPLNPQDLLARADAAAYEAKAAGGGRFAVASESSETQQRRRNASEWIERMRHALDHGGFMLFAQPIVPLTSRSDPAFEVLLRLQGDRGEPLTPGSFIPFAEAYNLVAEIDRWVLSHTLGALAECNLPGRCFMNISGASLDEPGFTDDVADMIRNSTVPGRSIALEVTETATVRYPERAREFIEQLRALDCWVALDDFGSGFSSLGQLGDLPADVLKIDGVLVRDIADDRRSLAMLRSVVGMAQALGMRTIAEHVESEETLRALTDIGADWAQGFHLGAPRPLHKVLEEIAGHDSAPRGPRARRGRALQLGAKAGPSRP